MRGLVMFVLPQEIYCGAVGQQGYARVTRAGGLLCGSSLTGGIGNQRDTVRRTVTTSRASGGRSAGAPDSQYFFYAADAGQYDWHRDH